MNVHSLALNGQCGLNCAAKRARQLGPEILLPATEVRAAKKPKSTHKVAEVVCVCVH